MAITRTPLQKAFAYGVSTASIAMRDYKDNPDKLSLYKNLLNTKLEKLYLGENAKVRDELKAEFEKGYKKRIKGKPYRPRPHINKKTQDKEIQNDEMSNVEEERSVAKLPEKRKRAEVINSLNEKEYEPSSAGDEDYEMSSAEEGRPAKRQRKIILENSFSDYSDVEDESTNSLISQNESMQQPFENEKDESSQEDSEMTDAVAILTALRKSSDQVAVQPQSTEVLQPMDVVPEFSIPQYLVQQSFPLPSINQVTTFINMTNFLETQRILAYNNMLFLQAMQAQQPQQAQAPHPVYHPGYAPVFFTAPSPLQLANNSFQQNQTSNDNIFGSGQ